MKLKDKKIEILGKTYTHDKYGNSKVSLHPLPRRCGRIFGIYP
ncbi:hypothetical protein ACMWD3_02290 [Gardnerella swidsinskii]|nr:hypothetical protein [Gardnerella sp. DNF01162]MDK6295495.1 hypothetical protein [Gardnerella swidsinskii]MDK7092706.1 hypothetical protein [Gardnerella swidsinskii]